MNIKVFENCDLVARNSKFENLKTAKGILRNFIYYVKLQTWGTKR